ncbi:hypothetical protein A359_00510 [secondary endosymbiont of Ctenarytaina eucalypti]|uniref:Uncharacterized protein n=1 Tax=secondary endosymbiont of Ctenarytaina eucalypti TaxID=1199245 RepID=J3TEW7_9ENTR|nr:hypothetical protein A359_00510 [secondary endosymbiont of Ctenarytaina eucalypti]
MTLRCRSCYDLARPVSREKVKMHTFFVLYAIVMNSKREMLMVKADKEALKIS